MRILKIEIKKAMTCKLLWISVIIGVCITLLSFVYIVNDYFYYLKMQETAREAMTAYSNPHTQIFILYDSWIGGETFSPGTSIYFFIFPLLVSIPYGWSYCEEKNGRYKSLAIVRCQKYTYYVAKYAAVFLSGGITMTLPLVVNFIMAAMVFPAITPEVYYEIYYGVFGSSLMAGLYYTKPLLYVVLYMCIDFIIAGLIACLSILSASVIKYRVIAVIFPMVVCLIIHFARNYIYISSNISYKELSPLFFLRGAETAYKASWLIIFLEAAILLAVFIIGIVWEQKHEVY